MCKMDVHVVGKWHNLDTVHRHHSRYIQLVRRKHAHVNLIMSGVKFKHDGSMVHIGPVFDPYPVLHARQNSQYTTQRTENPIKTSTIRLAV